MKIVNILLLAVLFASCGLSNPKAKKMLVRVENYNSSLFADPCARLYPINEKVIKETEYLPGKIDTIPGETKYVNCEDTANKGKVIPVKCPDSYKKVDTAKITETIERESTAKIALLEQELESERQKCKGLETALVRKIVQLETKLLNTQNELEYWLKIKRITLISLGSLLALFLVILGFKFNIYTKLFKFIFK